MDAVSEIKARLPIEELVGQYCQIKQKGRNFVALCPFHNDTKPSLNIAADKGIAYCFACRTGGDIFSFYQSIEGVDFIQALKDLAEKTGVDLPRRRESSGVKKDEKERLRSCLEEALAFYRKSLMEDDAAQKYVSSRKLTRELLNKFEIGFAPDSFDATYSHLLKAGYGKSEIIGAGLGIQKELREERIYDRFRNRIIFPIRNHQGNLIGFGGRAIGEDDAKYINSPDGPLYNKSAALFGISMAKEAIRKAKSVILVEGYFDVIAFHRIGIENVVSVSGVALTQQHVNIIKRAADKIILCLDQDTAGRQAAERAYMLCKVHNLNVRWLSLPAGKDPDECVAIEPKALKKAAKEGGVEYLDAILCQIQSEMRIADSNGREKPERTVILHRLLPLLNAIPSSVEREDFISKTAAMLGTTITALKDDMRRANASEIAPKPLRQKTIRSTFTSTELLMGLLLVYPDNIDVMDHMLEPEREKEKLLFSSLKENLKSGMEKSMDKEMEEYAGILQLYCEENFSSWSARMARKEIKKLSQKVNRSILLKKQKELITGIREARKSGKKMEEEKLLTQYQQVLKLVSMA